MNTIYDNLDNPVWHSLNEIHKELSFEYHGSKFYNPEYCPFGGFTSYEKSEKCIDQYAQFIDSFYVVGEKPTFGQTLTLRKNLICNQMLLETATNVEINQEITELNSARQKEDLFQLVNLVQPGYFRPKTSDLGNYFGIYKNDMLVAVTGERMKMDKFTEISAVITRPQHTGKGYAKQLITHAVDKIFQENKIPYLHVASANIGAIKLYEKLGFITRRKISFWNLALKS